MTARRLRSDLQKQESCEPRHTISDTVSSMCGIGAARRWIKKQFQQAVAAAAETRLLPRLLFNVIPKGLFKGWRRKLEPGTTAVLNDIQFAQSWRACRKI